MLDYVQYDAKWAWNFINGDLPVHLYTFMNDEIISPAIYVEEFQRYDDVRDEFRQLVRRVLRPWSGKYKNTTLRNLKHQLEIGAACGENDIFKWYVCKFSPTISKWARNEESENNLGEPHFNTNRLPFTLMILMFLHLTSIDNFDDIEQYKFEHLVWVTKWFKSYAGQLAILEKEGARYISSPQDSKLSFQESLNLLQQELWVGLQPTDEMKELWRSRLFFDMQEWLRLAHPNAYLLRHNKDACMQALNYEVRQSALLEAANTFGLDI